MNATTEIYLHEVLTRRAYSTIFFLDVDTVRAARQRLLELARGEPAEVHRYLMRLRNCGKMTADEICKALGFEVPGPVLRRHCPTCTCCRTKSRVIGT